MFDLIKGEGTGIYKVKIDRHAHFLFPPIVAVFLLPPSLPIQKYTAVEFPLNS